MSKVKPFLLALSLIPISLSAFQTAALAQIVGSPSKGLAGSASGNNGLSVVYTKDKTTTEIVLTDAQKLALNLKATELLAALGSVTGTLKTVVNDKSSLNVGVAIANFQSSQGAYTSLMGLNRAPTTVDGFKTYAPDFSKTSVTAGGATISYSIDAGAASNAKLAATYAANPKLPFAAVMEASNAASLAIGDPSLNKTRPSTPAAQNAFDAAIAARAVSVNRSGPVSDWLALTGKALNAMLDVYSEKITIAFEGKTLTLDTSKYTDRASAVSAATAVLSAGGTVAQAELAASLAGTGADPAACIALVGALSGLFADNQIANLPTTIPTAFLNNASLLTATGIKTKSLDFGKNLIAQTRATVQVDAKKLNDVILAYNDVIDKSTPEAVANLSKNEDFKLISSNLRDLRASIR